MKFNLNDTDMTQERFEALVSGLNHLIFNVTAKNIKVEGNVLEADLGSQHITVFIQKRKGRDFLRRRFSISEDAMKDAWALRADWIFMQNTDNPMEIIACPVSLRAREFGKLRPIVTFDEVGEKVYTYILN